MTAPAATSSSNDDIEATSHTDPRDPVRTLRTFRPQLLSIAVAVFAAIVDQYGLAGGARLSSSAWAAILTVVLAGAVATAARTIHTRIATPAMHDTDPTAASHTAAPDRDADVAEPTPADSDLETETGTTSVLQPLRRDLVALLARNRIRVQHTYGGEEPYSLALRGGRAAVVVCAECDGADPHASAAVRRLAELVARRPEMADAQIVVVYTDRGKYGPVRDGNLILASSATVLRAVQQATAAS
jgi:hypothetical protein